MANAWIHAKSSARKHGGEIEDYLSIHMKMDCSKAYVADNRHMKSVTFGMMALTNIG